MNQITRPEMSGLIIILLFIGLYIFVDNEAPPSGYCASQQRYISDDEFSQTSLALLNFKRHRDKLDWDKDPVAYQSDIKSYEVLLNNQKHDGFTAVDRSESRSIFRRVLDYQRIQVTLNANSGDEHIRFYYDICGKLLDSDTALRSRGFQTITTTDFAKINN